MEDRMKKYFALALLPLLIASAFADMSPASQDAQKQPRMLGQKAVLHVYYYTPKTLEITYVDSYLFEDESACENAISAALKIAMPYAGEGDLVSAKCVGMNPPEAITKPEKKRESPGSTEL
jgi:hypothetical protein